MPLREGVDLPRLWQTRRWVADDWLRPVRRLVSLVYYFTLCPVTNELCLTFKFASDCLSRRTECGAAFCLCIYLQCLGTTGSVWVSTASQPRTRTGSVPDVWPRNRWIIAQKKKISNFLSDNVYCVWPIWSDPDPNEFLHSYKWYLIK